MKRRHLSTLDYTGQTKMKRGATNNKDEKNI